MTAKKTHEELVELLQAGKIGFLRFSDGRGQCRGLFGMVPDPTARILRMNPQSFMSNRRTLTRWTVR